MIWIDSSELDRTTHKQICRAYILDCKSTFIISLLVLTLSVFIFLKVTTRLFIFGTIPLMLGMTFLFLIFEDYITLKKGKYKWSEGNIEQIVHKDHMVVDDVNCDYTGSVSKYFVGDSVIVVKFNEKCFCFKRPEIPINKC